MTQGVRGASLPLTYFRSEVEVLDIGPDTDKKREGFLRLVFGNHEGDYFCIAYAPRDRKNFKEEYFKYPDEMPEALKLINKVYRDHNVWFSPMLYSRRKRAKEYVCYTPNAWSDLDTCGPDDLFIQPTILIESSPRRYAGLWTFDREIEPIEAEAISQRIAYAHADAGADRTGWDLTQLLRMPATYNLKYSTSPTVTIIDANRKRFRPSDWDNEYPAITTFQATSKPVPQTTGGEGLELLESKRLQLTPTVWRLYNEELPEGQRSEALWKLCMFLFEAGFDTEQTYAICLEAKCNKHDEPAKLWADVCRAESVHIQNTNQFQVGKLDASMAPLVSDEEREAVQAEESFVERYITWAKSLGDAAPQYHQAGAFTALSALLAGSVQLPTSFGVIKPNLWFMILADTTLTRKSTAMDIAMDLVGDIDDDAVMATDGSIEGLLTSLSTRTGRPSVFLRDEFSGLLESINKKDYYAGMPEFLTKLYDGKMQKRLLRKESIEVRDPCLLIFAGGIKDKITSLLTFEQVSSGFMPRFIFITAESDITRVRPLGPPTEWTDNNRQAIQDELEDLYQYYNQTIPMTITGTKITHDAKLKVNAQLTPEAWLRYNRLESEMLDVGIHSERPDIMTPVYDRLAKSILKAALLLAAAKKKNDPITIEVEDIVRAAVYGESWRLYVNEVMANVGKGGAERMLDNIHNFIKRRPGVNRSAIMQNYHLDARMTSALFETLEQRHLITRQRQGKAETLWPYEIKITPEEKQ